MGKSHQKHHFAMFVHFPYLKKHHCFISPPWTQKTLGNANGRRNAHRLCGGQVAEQQDQGQDPPKSDPYPAW